MLYRASQRPVTRTARGTAMAIVMACGLATVGTAGAATLGGITSRTLLSINQSVSFVAPTILRCDDFSRAASTGTAINNRPVQLPANCGVATWTVSSGNWNIINGTQARAQGGAGVATVPVGVSDMSVESSLQVDNGTRTGGITVSHNTATNTYLGAMVSGTNQVQVQYVANGGVTTLATVSVTLGTNPTFRLTRQGTAVTLTVNGAVVSTLTLTAARATTLSAGTRAGMYRPNNGLRGARFYNFLATSPSP